MSDGLIGDIWFSLINRIKLLAKLRYFHVVFIKNKDVSLEARLSKYYRFFHVKKRPILFFICGT